MLAEHRRLGCHSASPSSPVAIHDVLVGCRTRRSAARRLRNVTQQKRAAFMQRERPALVTALARVAG